MPQCGKLFSEFENQPGALKLDGVLARMKYESQQRSTGDLKIIKAVIDFKRQMLLGARLIITDDIECELIPMSNISRISIPKGQTPYRNTRENEPEVEEAFHDDGRTVPEDEDFVSFRGKTVRDFGRPVDGDY